ncbi:hypothetical protein MNEG_5133 [Monoraphidium neglectum]|uniref:Uncharacterized protein n=1 Tax=Monoraphidium neglectum TaxID=145388 RepID=A0A0D2NBG3_9CHLO|nr:hypothetical protein MNEG_5133 [Monoraphidium neglectum]KIZ02826.1 hypothetical protein MNEG_5133 [Monoraphidium neglectum]|eukprot:XP_013901845.1 hypothetical protein MNEG_5133 [Monoraphidium neglectum]
MAQRGSVSLFQVSGDPSAPEDQSLLLVSFEGAARGTIALAMAGDGAALSQLEAPGVDAASPCIWAGGVPGGWGAQATAEGIRIAGPAPAWSLAFEWRSTQGPLSLAAAHGSYLVTASADRLAALHVSPVNGALALLAQAELPQQASALAVFPAPASGSAGELLVAVGLWVENAVLLLRWHAAGPGGGGLQPVGRLELWEQQPRSLAALDVAGRCVLLAGSSQGQPYSC